MRFEWDSAKAARNMKKPDSDSKDDLRSEYDFAKLSGGVRGKYAQDYKEGTNLVLLSPDIAEYFPDDESVNRALRSLVEIAKSRVRTTE